MCICYNFTITLCVVFRSLLHRIVAVTMALLMFTSSTGLSFDLHYCQGQLQNVSIFGEAKSCHEKAKEVKSSHCKKKQTACHKNTDTTKSCEENNCCQNENSFLRVWMTWLQVPKYQNWTISN